MEQFKEFAKVWWMIWWRIWFIGLFLADDHGWGLQGWLLGGIGAGALVYGLKKSICTFPIRSLIKGDGNVVYLLKNGHNRPAKSTKPKYTPSTTGRQPPLVVIDKPSGPGALTGFEPRTIDRLSIGRHAKMFGNPGTGLSSSGFDNKAIQLGQQGEQRFAKTLIKTGDIEKFATYWSVAMPDDNGTGNKDLGLDTDIDAIIMTKHSLYLVDLKNYRMGDVTYHNIDASTLGCRDNKTGSQVGQPKKMTKNMSMADERIKKLIANNRNSLRVKSVVLLMPTDNGTGTVNNVYWPSINKAGSAPIRGITLPDFLRELSQETPINDPSENSIHFVIRKLLK